jgi:hypothetical protein
MQEPKVGVFRVWCAVASYLHMMSRDRQTAPPENDTADFSRMAALYSLLADCAGARAEWKTPCSWVFLLFVHPDSRYQYSRHR